MNLLPLTVFPGRCETRPPQTLFQPATFSPSGHKQQSLRAVTLFPQQGWGHGIHHSLWLNYTSAQLKVKAITGLSLPLWPPSSPFLCSPPYKLHYSLTTPYRPSLWHPCFLVLFVCFFCSFSNFMNFLSSYLTHRRLFFFSTFLSCAVWRDCSCRLLKSGQSDDLVCCYFPIPPVVQSKSVPDLISAMDPRRLVWLEATAVQTF